MRLDTIPTRAVPLACPRCGLPVDIKSRHVAVAGSAIQVYCSSACLEGTSIIEAPVVTLPSTARRRGRWWLTAGFLVGGAVVGVSYLGANDEDDAAPPAHAFFAPPPLPPPIPIRAASNPPAREHEPRRADDEALLRELAHDAWIHPLAGPDRRMPRAHIQAFGAARVVELVRPECGSGHCGVDIGVGEGVWGERVHAVHDGVVAWVNRGPNEEYGGAFVKLAHRDGALFSWYFHLAAIPRWVRPGAKVKVGQIIGVVGDTGLKKPVPHLHFEISVKPPHATREHYIDPEPLVAIWPLWLPDNRHVSTSAPPGMPVRSRGPVHRRTPAVTPGSAAPPLPEPESAIPIDAR